MAKSLIEVLTEHKAELQDSSNGRKIAHCPFHAEDNEPSFTVYSNGTYYCFACEVWGDALKFLVDFNHWSNKQALEYLGEDYKQASEEKPKVIKIKNTLRMYEFIYGVAQQYHDFLMRTPGAINYLKSRGLSDETIERYKIGYTDGKALRLSWTWEYEQGYESGIITKGGYEYLSHRITIPNLTEPDEADFMIGRTVTNDKIKYIGIRTPKPLHGFYECRHSPILFVVEGQFDHLTLRQWGYPAIAMSGTHITKANRLLLNDRKLVIVPDGGDVGAKAGKSLKESFGDKAYILDYSELGVKDVSELAESPGGKMLFDTIVKEQVDWITSLSIRHSNRWFPSLAITTNSLLI